MKRIQLPKKLLSALCAAALLVGAMPGALAAESTQQVSIQQQSIATNAGVFTYIDAQGSVLFGLDAGQSALLSKMRCWTYYKMEYAQLH